MANHKHPDCAAECQAAKTYKRKPCRGWCIYNPSGARLRPARKRRGKKRGEA